MQSLHLFLPVYYEGMPTAYQWSAPHQEFSFLDVLAGSELPLNLTRTVALLLLNPPPAVIPEYSSVKMSSGIRDTLVAADATNITSPQALENITANSPQESITQVMAANNSRTPDGQSNVLKGGLPISKSGHSASRAQRPSSELAEEASRGNRNSTKRTARSSHER